MKRRIKTLAGSFFLVLAFIGTILSQQRVAHADSFYTITGTLTDRYGNHLANMPLAAIRQPLPAHLLILLPTLTVIIH